MTKQTVAKNNRQASFRSHRTTLTTALLSAYLLLSKRECAHPNYLQKDSDGIPALRMRSSCHALEPQASYQNKLGVLSFEFRVPGQ